VLGLPSDIGACLFDPDGVLTQTAKVRAAACKKMFDDHLEQRATANEEKFVAFDLHRDYLFAARKLLEAR